MNLSSLQSQSGPATLVVVTKKQPAKIIAEVIEAGATDLGENRLQEILDKYDPELFYFMKQRGVRLHFIGQLQSNKIAKIVRLCDMIQSVDSLDKAEKIDKAAAKFDKVMPILLQLNLTDEAQKAGVTEEQLAELVPQIQTLDHIDLQGFMTMGKAGDEQATRQAFQKCKVLADQYKLTEVSMGMSGDFEIALEEGSTMVRIGSRIFENL